MTLYKHNFRY